ncbi:MAG: acetyltransferase [Chloroflexota bacterium]|nr:acetyltransferase [Chloroflexota bacterium]
MIDRDRSPLLVVGTGDHAHVILEAIRAGGGHVAGFLEVDGDSVHRDHWCELPVLGNLTASLGWRDGIANGEFIVGIGDNRVRAKAYQLALALGLKPATVVHPTATLLEGCVVGAGSQVCARAVVGVRATVGINTIVNTAATIDHDNVLGDHVSVGPGAHLAGRVAVGPFTHIGISASVNEGLTVGTSCLVAAGAAVIADVPDGTRVAGVPARAMTEAR